MLRPFVLHGQLAIAGMDRKIEDGRSD